MCKAFKTLEEKRLTMEELIKDILEERWNRFFYHLDIENDNPYAEFVLARGQVLFDSIRFNTEFGQGIYLFNKNSEKEHFLSIGGNISEKDNQIAYVNKEKSFNTWTNSISAIYTIHFCSTEHTVKFGASYEE